jgi:hypothetical protein
MRRGEGELDEKRRSGMLDGDGDLGEVPFLGREAALLWASANILGLLRTRGASLGESPFPLKNWQRA